MYFIRETDKSFERAAADLEKAVAEHGFGVLHVHDLGGTLRSKGIEFAEQCKVLEVCQPQQAAKVLAVDMRMNMALPCRLSVYTEGGKTYIGMIEPAQMLSSLSGDRELKAVADEVQARTVAMIEQAC